MPLFDSRTHVLKCLIVTTLAAYLSFGLIANAALALHGIP